MWAREEEAGAKDWGEKMEFDEWGGRQRRALAKIGFRRASERASERRSLALETNASVC